MDSIDFRPMTETDFDQVIEIYRQGIATGNATFQSTIPSWDEWNKSHLTLCRIVAVQDNEIVGWTALSPVSNRCVYGGVAEVSVYIASSAQKKNIGSLLLHKLIEESEQANIWTLQSGMFPENEGSKRLHISAGFRLVGYREKIGQMNGIWRDNLLMERRSAKIGITKKKILVLCTGNSCRSQIAEAYIRSFAGSKADIYSAGIEKHGVNPRTISTMKEDGIDISHHTSNLISDFTEIQFDFVITVCDHANEVCPVFPGKALKFHQNFLDPSKTQGTEEEIMQAFREVRQKIKDYCKRFVYEYIP